MIILACAKCGNADLETGEFGRLFCNRCNESKDLYELNCVYLMKGRYSDEYTYKFIVDTIQRAADAVFQKENSA